jgi:hypothetical protein
MIPHLLTGDQSVLQQVSVKYIYFEAKDNSLTLEDGHSIPISFASRQKPGICQIPGFLVQTVILVLSPEFPYTRNEDRSTPFLACKP